MNKNKVNPLVVLIVLMSFIALVVSRLYFIQDVLSDFGYNLSIGKIFIAQIILSVILGTYSQGMVQNNKQDKPNMCLNTKFISKTITHWVMLGMAALLYYYVWR